MKSFGRADIIINNATVVTVGTIQDVSLADWDRTCKVNLKAPVALIREFLPGMIKRNMGTIRNIQKI